MTLYKMLNPGKVILFQGKLVNVILEPIKAIKFPTVPVLQRVEGGFQFEDSQSLRVVMEHREKPFVIVEVIR